MLFRSYNLRGEEVRLNLNGMLARAVQHEYDHLDGVVFVDRMTSTARAKAQPMLDEFELGFRTLRQTGAVPGDDVIADRLAQWEQRYA